MTHPSILVDVTCSAAAIAQTPKAKRVVPITQPQNFDLEIEKHAYEARQTAERLRKLIAQVRRIRVAAEASNHSLQQTTLVQSAALNANERAELIAQVEEQYFDAKLHAENLELHADYEREKLNGF